MVVAGTVAALIGLFVVFGALYTGMRMGKGGHVFSVRPIPAYDAIPEAIGRATELGRPVMAVPGRADLNDARAPQTLAGLAILEYTARLCAKYDIPIIVPIHRANVYPLAQESVRMSYVTEGNPDRYQDGMVQFLSEEQFAFALGTVGLMQRENAASVLLVGYFEAETIMLAEAAGQMGAVLIGGCGSVTQTPNLVAVCDYCLIGEELMVADAYLNRRPAALGTVAGQDWIKMIIIGLIALGTLMGTVATNPLAALLKK